MLKTFPDLGQMEIYLSSQIHGAFSVMDMEILGVYVKELKTGDKYLEIGTDFGKSAASAIWQSPEGIKFYFCDIVDAVEQFLHPTRKLTRREFFEQEGLDTIGEFILMDSKELAKIWDKGELAMIFVDGNHSYESVKVDIELWWPHLKSDGWMLFHDYDDPTSPGVCRAVDELKYSGQLIEFFTSQEKYELKSSIAGGRKK